MVVLQYYLFDIESGFSTLGKKIKFFIIIVYVISITLYESGKVTLVGVGIQLSGEMDFNSRGSGKVTLDVDQNIILIILICFLI